MKKTRRTSRVGENIRDALVQVLRTDLKGVDIGWSSISEVEVSPDLHYAKVHITGLKEDDTKEAVEALRNAAPRIRHLLGKRIHLRYTPELDFRYDETSMRASRIELILSEVMPKGEAGMASDEAGEEDEPQSQSGDETT